MMVEIDGSLGEGGGQILRTALSLSCILGRPFRIFDIRKGRKKPGLMPQHLAAVRASALISGASVQGGFEGSTALSFSPGPVKAGDYRFDIGTAGSTGLLAQTLLPPLIFSAVGASTLTLTGGTHAPMSPPFDYISDAFLPCLRRLGLEVSGEIESYGFYPRGGGRIRFRIRPASGVEPADFGRRGRLLGISGVSAVGNLPMSIAKRQSDALISGLGFAAKDVPVRIENIEVSAPGRGTFVFFSVLSEGGVAGFSALGRRGKRAEAVGEEAASEFAAYHSSGACLDRHMADQLVLYLALAKGQSKFTTEEITGHLRTNLTVLKMFLPISYGIESGNVVTIKGAFG